MDNKRLENERHRETHTFQFFSIISTQWEHVTSYDNLCFNYDKLKEYRRGKNKYAIFSLEELLNLQKDDIETTSLCVDFGQDFGQKVEDPVF